MVRTIRFYGTVAGLAVAFMATGALAQFVPPAGYSGDGRKPGVATPADPQAPRLKRLSDSAMMASIQVDPSYRRGETVRGHAKVVGAFTIAETRTSRFVSAWAPGFLPVTLSFSDGRCFSLKADYEGGTLSNGRMVRAACERPAYPDEAPVATPAADSPLQRIGAAWSYGAWWDAKRKVTIVTAPYAKRFQPLFAARMKADAIMAMNSPDAPMGDVTLVGRIDGRLTVLTLEVSY